MIYHKHWHNNEKNQKPDRWMIKEPNWPMKRKCKRNSRLWFIQHCINCKASAHSENRNKRKIIISENYNYISAFQFCTLFKLNHLSIYVGTYALHCIFLPKHKRFFCAIFGSFFPSSSIESNFFVNNTHHVLKLLLFFSFALPCSFIS